MWSILIETKPLQKDWKTEAMSPSRPSGRLRLANWYLITLWTLLRNTFFTQTSFPSITAHKNNGEKISTKDKIQPLPIRYLGWHHTVGSVQGLDFPFFKVLQKLHSKAEILTQKITQCLPTHMHTCCHRWQRQCWQLMQKPYYNS